MSPFTANAAQSLAALGERRLIVRIREWLGPASAPAPRGIGDDCAVLPAAPTLRFPAPAASISTGGSPALFRLATTDSVLFGRHFDASVSPRAAGAKLIKRNLSDIAAMGGIPTDALLSLVCGRDLAVSWLEEFFRGIADTCLHYNVELAGGDCAEATPGFFCATLALTGFAEKPLLRTGARPGDTLLVTGTLGGSLSGKHFEFSPRLAEGRWLAARPEIRAGMDITDGLAKDIPSLLPCACDALLDANRIPISAAAQRLSASTVSSGVSPESAAKRSLTPLAHALGDGEDYELLVAADTASLALLLADWQREFPDLSLTPIGVIARAGQGQASGKGCDGERGGESEGGRLLDAATNLPFATDVPGYSHFKDIIIEE
jgi:thiamine-monophosphate kinase